MSQGALIESVFQAVLRELAPDVLARATDWLREPLRSFAPDPVDFDLFVNRLIERLESSLRAGPEVQQQIRKLRQEIRPDQTVDNAIRLASALSGDTETGERN